MRRIALALFAVIWASCALAAPQHPSGPGPLCAPAPPTGLFQDLGVTGGVISNGTRTTAAAFGPECTAPGFNASIIIEDSTNNQHTQANQPSTVTSAGVHGMGVFVSRAGFLGTPRNVQLDMAIGVSIGELATNFSLDTCSSIGIFVQTTVTNPGFFGQHIRFADGSVGCWLDQHATTSGAGTNVLLSIKLLRGAVFSYTGNGQSGIRVRGEYFY